VREYTNRVYVVAMDDEILYFIDAPWACNCKDCVRIEPVTLDARTLHARIHKEGADPGAASAEIGRHSR